MQRAKSSKKITSPRGEKSSRQLINLLNLALNSAWDGFSIWRAIRDRSGNILDFEMIYSNEPSKDPVRAITARLVHKPIDEVIINGDLERVKRALRNSLEEYAISGVGHKVTLIDGWHDGTEQTVIALTADEVLIANLDKKSSNSIVKHHDWLYEHDPLTGLINQVLLDELLSQALMQLQVKNEPFVFGIIDLDDFRRINDQEGRAFGDAVLRNFAELLQSKLRKIDRLIRLTEDDFALILKDSHDLSEITTLSKSLLQSAKKGWRIDDRFVNLSFSAGFVLVTDHHVMPREIYHLAESQMFKVKNQGKNGALSTVLHGLVAS